MHVLCPNNSGFVYSADAEPDADACNVAGVSCNVARVSCNVTGNTCNITRNTCNITGNTWTLQETRATLQETCATLNETRATLHETCATLHETPATLQETPAILQETCPTLQETPATLHETMQHYMKHVRWIHKAYYICILCSYCSLLGVVNLMIATEYFIVNENDYITYPLLLREVLFSVEAVCLFVCLFVSKITRKRQSRRYKTFTLDQK